MPELPEVETIARSLRTGHQGPPLTGQKIERVSLSWPRHIGAPSVSTFRRRIRNQTIGNIGRRGKYLIFHLDQGFLLIHLKMSGDLHLVPKEIPRDPHDHTIFYLANSWQLRFNDVRKFGRMYLVEDPEEILGNLGPEPLHSTFTAKVLRSILKNKRRIIKHLLLDQSFLAGLGNIYTDEALHLAGIHPLRRSDTLNPAEIQSLWEGIRKALRGGIKHNGASIDWVYRGGSYQNHFRVYQRAGEPCSKCGSMIERIVLGQRGTHFCPTCQPEAIS